jgi:flagellum-specific peptidoglycan hydrolase FlgJ
MALTTEQKKQNTQLNAPLWVDLLINNGAKPELVKFMIAQIVFETGWFNNTSYKLDNNPAGITWNANYKNRSGASKGSLRSANEGGNYVHFATKNDAAIDYLRIINRSGKLGKPTEATNVADYVHRLKANGYFAGDETQYKNGLISVGKKLDEWANVTALIEKKKNSGLNFASFNPIILLLLLGGFFYLKK